MKRTKQNSIGPEEALQILESAVTYCQRAGLLVRAGNADRKLVITVDGAYLERAGTETRFCVSAGTDSTSTLADAGTLSANTA